MNRRILLVALLVVMTLGLESCGTGPRGCCCAGGRNWTLGEKVRGSGRVVRADRSVGSIDAVHLGTVGTLHVKFGNREELTIEGEDNIIEHLEIVMDDGTLKIVNERNYSLRPSEPLDYYLTVKDLERISLSSSGDAIVADVTAPRFSIDVSSSGDVETGSIETGSMKVRISSSGDVIVPDLESKNLDVSISSSGGLEIGGGSVVDQEVRLSSSGSYRAGSLRSERADVRVSSSGSAYILVTDDLNARLSSSGSVYYSGRPRVRQRTSSSGRLRHLDV